MMKKQHFLIKLFRKMLTPSKLEIPFDYPDRWQLQKKEAPAVSQQVKVKILVLSSLFPHPNQPGLGSFVLDQIKGLQNTGQDIDIRVISGRPHCLTGQIRHPLRTLKNPLCMLRNLCTDFYRFSKTLYNFLIYYHACNKHWWSVERVSVKYLPYPILGGFWTHGWGYQKAITRSAKKLKKTFDFNIIHAHTGYLDGNAARKIGLVFDCPCIITEHTGPFSILTEHPWVRKTTVRALTNAKHIVAVSTAQRQHVSSCLKNKHKKTIHVIPNVVDFDRFYPASNWTPDPMAPNILFVGYFTPVKNISLLLKAFQLVHVERPCAKLTLVGGGYTLALQSTLPNHDKNQAEAGVIYLSEKGPDNYLVRGWDRTVQTGRLDGIDLAHLAERDLDDVAFKSLILMITSAAAHTIGGAHPSDYTQQIMQEIKTLNLANSVKLTGPVPHTDVSNFMKHSCDIFALSSSSESFGCVVAEALATGKPVVSTRCGGPEDIITEDWMGTTCENNNPEAFAQAILNLADRLPTIDPNQLRKSAQERFSPKVIAEQYMRLYQHP